MQDIKFNSHEKSVLVQKLKTYFLKELDQDIGQFDAEFLLDFISEEIGAFYYNKGLSDAEAIINAKVADIADALYEAERPTQSTIARKA